MRNIKDELQNIILGDEPVGAPDQLKKIQVFLRRYAETGVGTQKRQRLKGEEAAELINFARREKLFYEHEIREAGFIAAGAEQRGNMRKSQKSWHTPLWREFILVPR